MSEDTASKKKPIQADEHTQTYSGMGAADKTRIITTVRPAAGDIKMLPTLQLQSGPEQGRLVLLPSNKRYIVGRSKESDLCVADSSCSRKHAEFFVTPEATVILKDLGSTNGTLVNGYRVKEPTELHDGDKVQLGDNLIFKFSFAAESDAQVQIEIYKKATRDALTNASNRSTFTEALSRELAHQSRKSISGLALIMFDVDHFKKINDSFGHLCGDEVLREIGRRIPTLMRKEDLFARVGGEEFAVITRTNDQETLKGICERIRLSMESTPAEYEGRQILFTISVGAALVMTNSPLTNETVVQAADEALYEAKNGGRNRCAYREIKT